MSLYKLGVSGGGGHTATPIDLFMRTGAGQSLSAYKRGVEVGAWIATPGWLKEQINMLGAEYDTIGRELRAGIDFCLPDKPDADSALCKELRQFTAKVWTPLKIEWDVFRENHQKWYENFWGATWDSVRDYRQKLISIRRQAIEVGFLFQSPEPAPPVRTPWESLGQIVKWILAGLFGLAGLWLLKLIFQRGN